MYTTTRLYLSKMQTDQGETITVTGGYAVTLDGQIVTTTIGAEPYLAPHQAPEIYRQRITAQKQADYLNGKVCEFPQIHIRALRAAFKTTESSWNPGVSV